MYDSFVTYDSTRILTQPKKSPSWMRLALLGKARSTSAAVRQAVERQLVSRLLFLLWLLIQPLLLNNDVPAVLLLLLLHTPLLRQERTRTSISTANCKPAAKKTIRALLTVKADPVAITSGKPNVSPTSRHVAVALVAEKCATAARDEMTLDDEDLEDKPTAKHNKYDFDDHDFDFDNFDYALCLSTTSSRSIINGVM